MKKAGFPPPFFFVEATLCRDGLGFCSFKTQAIAWQARSYKTNLPVGATLCRDGLHLLLIQNPTLRVASTLLQNKPPRRSELVSRWPSSFAHSKPQPSRDKHAPTKQTSP